MKSILSLVCLWCVLARPCSASDALGHYQFDVWNTDNGLPQNSVLAILRTRDGYLWFTTSGGLVRYNGVRLSVFDKRNSRGLNSNRFTTLFEDRRGCLWIGTEDGGMTRYEGGGFTTYTTADGLPGNWVMAVREDQEGNLWILTDRGIVQRKNERFIPFKPNDGLPLDLYAFREQGRGGISFYDSAGLHRLVQGHYLTYTPSHGLPSLNITSAFEDQRGDLWIGTKDAGLSRLQNGRFTVYTAKDGLPSNELKVIAACEDRKGNLWLATASGGLSRLKNGAYTRYGTAQGLSSDRVTTIYEDREGGIWIGTMDNGLNRLREQMITVYSVRDGLASNNVYPIYEDRQGNVWIGAWDGGLNKYRDGIFTLYNRKEDGLFPHGVSALCEDREGSLWIGTYGGGVSRFKDGRFTVYTNTDGLSDNSVFAIHQGREGSLWFGTLNGLTRLKDRVFTIYTAKDGLPSNEVRALSEDRRGDLWIGTIGGLARFRGGTFTTYAEMSGSYIRAIHEDGEGVLWTGTYDGGLNRLKDGKFTSYTTGNGLFDNGVFQILEDSRGNFWMSCNRGIYRVSKQELNDLADGKIKSVTSIAYGKSDGLLSTECNGGTQPAGWKRRDGQLWFPTQKGIAVIDPELIQTNTVPPPVVIESCILDDQAVLFRDGVKVPPGAARLEIHYAGLSFIKPGQVRFRYRLEGLDKEWVEAGTRRAAYYSYLPPGEYTFQVNAANSDGVWNTAGQRLRIVVVPPFWRTWWFLTLALLGVVGAAILVYERRLLRLRRAHAAQAAFSRQLIGLQEGERKKIAAELHDGLGQSLLIIKNRALLGLTRPEDQTVALTQLNEISSAASQAIDDVRSIARNLRPYQLDRLGLTLAIESILTQVSSSSAIRFSAEIDPIDNLFSPEAEINLYRIVQESVNNIVKHSGATEGRVVIKREARSVHFTVEDNGRGFLPEATTTAESQKRGFGLAGIAERTGMIGGTHLIRSAPGKGTTIIIKFGLPQRTEGGPNDKRGEN